MEENKRTFEIWWMSLISCKSYIIGSLLPSLLLWTFTLSLAVNWNKDAATILCSSRKHTFWSSSRNHVERCIRGRERGAGGSPPSISRDLFFPLISRVRTSGREGQKWENSDMVNGAEKTICLCQITDISVLDEVEVWQRAFRALVFRLLRLQESKIELMNGCSLKNKL